MARITLINKNDAPSDALYAPAAQNSALPVYGEHVELLYIEPNPRFGAVGREACERRGYPVRVCSRAEQAIQMFRDRPASIVICEFGLAQGCLAEIRALPGGFEAQFLITASGDLHQLGLRRFAHEVRANGLISWPLSVIDLIDTLEQSGYASQKRFAAPSPTCVRNAATVAGCWARRETGRVRITRHPDVSIALRDGELVAVEGGTLEDVLSLGTARFDAEPVHGAAQADTLPRQLLDIARRSGQVDVLAECGGARLLPGGRAAAMPVSPHTRRLLLDADGYSTLAELVRRHPSHARTVTAELSSLLLLSLLPGVSLEASERFEKIRSEVSRRLRRLEAGDTCGALSLARSASRAEQARAAERLGQRLVEWSAQSTLPAELQEDIRRLQQKLRAPTAAKKPSPSPSPSVRAPEPVIAPLLVKARDSIALWDWAAAGGVLAEALAQAPRHPEALALLGWVQFNATREVDAALALLERAVSLGDDNAEIHYFRACVQEAAGLLADARVSAQRAAALAPSDDLYRSFADELSQG